MKKLLPVVIILIMVLTIIVPYSFSRNANSSFFKVSKSQVNPGDTIEMTIDLNKIDYTLSKFTLLSDLNIDAIYENEEAIELEKDNDTIVININKEELDIDKITLYYDIPEDTAYGSIFAIVATVTNTDNTEEELTSMMSITVIEKSNSIKNNENNLNSEEKKNEVMKNDFGSSSNDRTASEKTSGGSSSSMSSSAGSSKGAMSGETAETVTYNGSDNNYLSSLSVDGYSLDKDFNKENSTYFVKTNSNVTSLNVEALAEDANAAVYVSGADNLKSGLNKILVSVTSESGQVRTYRIYVVTSANSSKVAVTGTSEITSALEENLSLHATYYYSEIYAEENQAISKGENILQYTNGEYLVAPYDCVVTQISIPEAGGQCTSKHYVAVVSTNVLQAQIKVSEEKINNISIGDEATVTVEAIGKDYQANVTKISNTASNGYFTVTVEFENDGDVKVGMTGNVKI